MTLTLLAADGRTARVELPALPTFTRPLTPLTSRVAYAAAHVVPKAWADNTPGRPADIDWDTTLAFRRHLYGWGLSRSCRTRFGWPPRRGRWRIPTWPSSAGTPSSD